MRTSNAQNERASTAGTRRWALRAIGGLVVGTGIAGAQPGGVTRISEPTVIDERGEYVLENDIETDADPIIRIEADHVTLDGNGHTIRSDGEMGISLEDVRQYTIEDVVIRASILGLIGREADHGTIRDTSANGYDGGAVIVGDNNRIEDNNHGSGGSAGIVVSGSNNQVVRNEPRGATGIAISGDSNTVRDNQCIGHSQTGISLHNATKTTVKNNNVAASEPNIRLEDSDDNTVTNNTAARGTGGIHLMASNNNTVARNDARKNDYGIYLDAADHNTVVRNDLRNTYTDAIIDDGENNRINANITD